MELKQALYMLPVPVSDGPIKDVLPALNIEIIKSLKHFVVENVRTARRFLKKLDPSTDISLLTFRELNSHTDEKEIRDLLQPLREGEAIGMMSEAGCPGIADPGAVLVNMAQQEGFRVVPLVGPSSIVLALMASGFNGQRFAFNGYLPIEAGERDKKIKDLENQSRRQDMTQIFIETPYRNDKMMECLLKNLSPDTLLCVGKDLTSPDNETIETKSVAEWKKTGYQFGKVPAIFLFYSRSAGKRRG